MLRCDPACGRDSEPAERPSDGDNGQAEWTFHRSSAFAPSHSLC